MKIRIGNDIRLQVALSLAGYDPINIQSVKAYLINVTRQKELEDKLKHKARFIRRFPKELHREDYIPTQYEINSGGTPCYSFLFVDHYNGFGVRPKWDEIYRHAEFNDVKYNAQVYSTENKNVIDILFPASLQKHTGVYKLLIVAKMYAPGYKPGNTRMITVDSNNVFELVGSTEEADADSSTIITTVASSDGSNSHVNVQDIYLTEGNYDSGNLRFILSNNDEVNVDVSALDSWYEGD